jgi:hypothetical protein
MNARQILREPLLHFLVAGGVLFAVFSLTGNKGSVPPTDKTITVDDEALLTFLQYRSKAFEPEYFTDQIQALSEQERKDLVDQFVEEEMLYREAKALGLEQGDYVIRQRLVQKMRFLMDDLTEGGSKPGDAVLSEYLKKNKDVYTLEPSVTFTHVFVDSTLHGDKTAREKAERLKAELNSRGAAFNDAPQFGDRFPFLQNYVERTPDFVTSHFGAEFLAGLEKIAPSENVWSGPVKSMHGYHLLMVTSRLPARLPELHEIRAQVEEDWLRDRVEGVRTQALSRLASEYIVEQKAFK